MPKRIINGQTYNTDTATLIAQAEQDFHDRDTFQLTEHAEVKIYQTRGGAFFLHTFSRSFRNDRNGVLQPKEDNVFEPMTREEVEEWVENAGYLDYEIELLSPTIGDPPEAIAEAEAVPASSIYVRMPTSLKVQIEEVAAANNLSINAWAVRCMETCLARNKALLERLAKTAS